MSLSHFSGCKMVRKGYLYLEVFVKLLPFSSGCLPEHRLIRTDRELCVDKEECWKHVDQLVHIDDIVPVRQL